MSDALAEAVRPIAQAIVTAVDGNDAHRIKRLLNSLDTQELYAVIVVLAAHADVPIVDKPRRRYDVDEVVVRRIINGDWKLAADCTVGEKQAVLQRWHEAGLSVKDLERLTGWTRLDRVQARAIERKSA